MMVQALLPANSSLEQTERVMRDVQKYFLEQEKEAVESLMTVAGINFSGRGRTPGAGLRQAEDWELQDRPDLRVGAVAEGPWDIFPSSATRWSLLLRRRRLSNWGRQRDLIFSCWTGAVSGMPS